MEGDQNESDIEQSESDNAYSCEMPRKKLNTSFDTMSISPVHLHGVAQHSRASTAKNKLDSTVEVLKTSLSDAYVMSTINLLALNLLMIFLRLNKRHQSLIICTIWYDERQVNYCYILWKDTDFDTCTKFMVPLIL